MLRKCFISLICLLCLSPIVVRGQGTPQYHEIAHIGRPSIQAIEWNPKQDLIAVASIHDIWLYDTQLKDVAHFELPLNQQEWEANGVKQPISTWSIKQVKWSPNGHWLTISISVITADGVTQPNIWQIWSRDGDRFTREMNRYPYISQIKWSPNGSQFAITNGNQISLLYTTSNEPIEVFQGIELDWSGDNQHLAVVTPQAIEVYNSQTLHLEADFPDTDKALHLALWNSDSTKIAAVGKNRLYVWDFLTQKTLVNVIHFFPNPYPEMGYGAFREPIRGIAWRPNHDEIAVSYTSLTTAELGRLSIWGVTSNIEIHSSVQGGHLVEMRWTPEGNKLISSGTTTFKFSELLDITSNIPSPKQDLPVTEWSYSTSQKYLIGYNHAYNIFTQLDPERFTKIKTFSGTAYAVQAVSWSSDDEHFVVASRDELQIWNISSGKKLYVNIDHNGIYTNTIIESSDQKYFALITRNLPYRFSQMCDSVRVWDAKARIPLLSLPINLGKSIYWIGNTHLLAIDEIKESKFVEQPCEHPSQFRILDARSKNILLTLNNQQWVYVNWAKRILSLYIQIISSNNQLHLAY